MKKKGEKQPELDDQLGCIGEFDADDELCTRFCALSLRCAIAYNQNTRVEVIEDLVASNSPHITIQ